MNCNPLNFIWLQDELNLYLVENKVKPTSWIDLCSLNNKEKAEKTFQKEGSKKATIYQLSVEGKNCFENYLKKKNIPFSCNYDHFFPIEKKGFTELYSRFQFSISSNEENLRKLNSAKEKNEVGLTLGYPKEAVELFTKVINNERRDNTYYEVCLSKAKQAGVDIPTWLGYISFIPDSIDLVNSDVSQSSKAIGRKYQEFVRENNPDLANRVEKEFSERIAHWLPPSWVKNPDMGYELIHSEEQKKYFDI